MERLISRICWNFMAARLPASQRMAQNTWLSCRKIFWNRWRLLSNWGISSPFERSMSQDVNFHDPIKGQTPLMPEPRWWNLTFACHIAIFSRFTLHQLSTHKVWFVLEWLPVCSRLATMAGNVDLVEILLEERLFCLFLSAAHHSLIARRRRIPTFGKELSRRPGGASHCEYFDVRSVQGWHTPRWKLRRWLCRHGWSRPLQSQWVSLGCDIEDEDPDFEDLVGGFSSERIELKCVSWLLDLYNHDQASIKVRILQEASGWENLPPNSQKLTMLLALHFRINLL